MDPTGEDVGRTPVPKGTVIQEDLSRTRIRCGGKAIGVFESEQNNEACMRCDDVPKSVNWFDVGSVLVRGMYGSGAAQGRTRP